MVYIQIWLYLPTDGHHFGYKQKIPKRDTDHNALNWRASSDGKKKRGIEANLVKVRHQGASQAFTLTIALKNKGKTTNMFLQWGITHYL